MQQERCPECGNQLQRVGQKWECSVNSLHKVTFNGRTTSGPGVSTPFAYVSPGVAQGGVSMQTVPLGYPAWKSPAENGVGLWHKLNCPFCDHEFRLNQAPVISTVNPGKVLHPGGSGVFKTVFGKSPLDGPAFTVERASYQCPNCQCPLPYRYESSTNISIGVMGSTFSGKTHYLAALLCQLVEGGLTRDTPASSVRFIPQTEDTLRALNEYRQVLTDQAIFESTRPFQLGRKGEIPVRKPLIFRMIIRNPVASQEARSVNLIFYDLAGEDIANETNFSQFGWPLLRAHAFIYLADVLSINGVVDLLPANKKPSPDRIARSTHYPPGYVLDKAMDVIRRWRRLPPDRQLTFPVAIMLSKADMLDEIIPAAERQNATYLNQTSYDGSIRLEELKRNHEAIAKWLYSRRETRLMQSALHVPNSSYFAVSATGSAPNRADKFTAVIQPRRCLDPLLWILWRLAEASA